MHHDAKYWMQAGENEIQSQQKLSKLNDPAHPGVCVQSLLGGVMLTFKDQGISSSSVPECLGSAFF